MVCERNDDGDDISAPYHPLSDYFNTRDNFASFVTINRKTTKFLNQENAIIHWNKHADF